MWAHLSFFPSPFETLVGTAHAITKEAKKKGISSSSSGSVLLSRLFFYGVLYALPEFGKFPIRLFSVYYHFTCVFVCCLLLLLLFYTAGTDKT
jgi:hypothetical protein